MNIEKKGSDFLTGVNCWSMVGFTLIVINCKCN